MGLLFFCVFYTDVHFVPLFYVQTTLDHRYEKQNGSECLMSIDCTDFRIQEPRPFSSVWYSHKFNGPGLRYELGVCIQTGQIVWSAGPFPPGDFNDLEIFRLWLKENLDENECVETDEGYRGDSAMRTPTDYEGNEQYKRDKARVMARHEAINGKLKEFGILRSVYRGDKNRHHLIFNAIVFIIHSEFLEGRGIWQCNYHLPRERTF